MVQGKSFTSNTTKLLKQLPKLKLIQDGEVPSPVMVHLSPTNACDLTCSFCCFANRKMKERLELDKVKHALDQFRELGATGLEFSVSKDEIIPYYDGTYLRIDTIDNIVQNQVGHAIAINDNGEHVVDKITDFFKHKQIEPLIKITLKTGRTIKVTKSHSVFFYENNKIIYKPVSSAKNGDLVVVSTKVLDSENHDIGDDYARLLGFFVAEGSYTFQRDNVPHGITFTFDAYDKEKKYVDDVYNILVNRGYNPSIDYFSNKTQIRISNKQLCEEFIALNMGRTAPHKKVPDIIFNATQENKIEFLKGLFAGDGTFRDTKYAVGGHRNSLELKTSSLLLQKTTGLLLQQLSINSTYNSGINPIRKIEDRILDESSYYTLHINGRNQLLKIESIIHYMDKKLQYTLSGLLSCNSRFKPIIINKDVIALPITKIEEVPEEEYVYDISVGQTERFISSFGILCHNTGGGQPTMHPDFDAMVEYAYNLGYAIGICTNGRNLERNNCWDKFTYIRLGMYGWDEGYTYNLNHLKGIKAKISGAYVWDFNVHTSKNPNVLQIWSDDIGRKAAKNFQKKENFYKMLDWVEANKIPTRIAFNAIKDPSEVLKDIEEIRQLIKDRKLEYAFLSDFNYKATRRNDHCYMHMVKPFIFTDGNVYVCPSSELSHENSYTMNPEFKLCDIDGITDYYKSLKGGAKVSMRHHDCRFCKYAMQNELIDDIVTETENNEFA